ncbi:MAG TPA: aspartyl protease family protein [Caulobacteraceae bacterium]|nr:aspartyl protease family protein [Caulobacteraceae bacterium]
MSVRTLDRRSFAAALLGAGFCLPGRVDASGGEATVEVESQASRLNPRQLDYVPPADLKLIIDIYRRMTAPVVIDGHGPFAFVVDTGANQSVVAAEIAAQLGLTAGAPRALNGVAGVEITPTALARIKVGSRPADDAVLQVLPAAAIGGQGMLGLDQLDGGRLTLDFRRQTLRIAPGRGGGAPFGDIVVRAHRRDGQLTLVDADLAGIPLTAFLDSGAQDTIGNMALRQLAISRYPTTPWSATPILSVTGQSVLAEMADLPALRIGGLHLPNWPVAFADLHTFRMWNLVERPAILVGVDILSRFSTVCLDFARDEVRFRLPSSA